MLLRFNWQIYPGPVIRERMREIEVTDECRDLIAAECPSDETGQRLPNGKWQIPVTEETWQRLQKTRRRGETISDCIIRIIIVTWYKRGGLP
jgi:hypothetical protein